MTDVNLEDLYQMFYEDPDFNGGLSGNPDDSKEEAAWDEAKSRFKQHKNNEKALKVGINKNKADEAKNDRKKLIRRKLLGKQQNPFAIATAKAKEMGYSEFSEGSEGDKKRGEIAEAIKEQKMQKQSGEIKKDFKFSLPKLPKKKSGSKFTTPSPIKSRRHSQPGKVPTFRKQKETTMDSEMIVNGILKDLTSKGIIKGHHGLHKDMSIPAIAGLLGAGAMLAKVFKLEDDDDDETISKQVVDFMGNNQDFFEGVAQMCEHICNVKNGQESSDDSRGERLIEAASAFHKACGGGGGGGTTASQSQITYQ